MTDRTKAMDILIAQDADLIELASGVTEADREVLIRISNSDDETAQRIRRGLIYTWEVGEIARHRKTAVAEERAKIVAWLRGSADFLEKHDDGLSGFDRIAQADRESADAIEAGEHLK